jgi:hypothetical protein
MAARSPERRHLSAAVAAQARHSGPDHPRVLELRDELAAEGLAEHIRRVVSSDPPLSAAQRERLALLLSPGVNRAS